MLNPVPVPTFAPRVSSGFEGLYDIPDATILTTLLQNFSFLFIAAKKLWTWIFDNCTFLCLNYYAMKYWSTIVV